MTNKLKSLEQLGIDNTFEKHIITEDVLLFVKDIFRPQKDCDGFSFCCVELVGSTFNKEGDEVFEYVILFEGVSLFDGVRHLYFGSEKTGNYGYLYYPRIQNIAKALLKLDELQVSKCEYVRHERQKDV